jgi:hypothetical protein
LPWISRTAADRMRRNRASANAELADLRAYGNGVFNRINRAYSALSRCRDNAD